MTHIDITSWLADRLVAERDLDRPALARLAADVRAEEGLWRRARPTLDRRAPLRAALPRSERRHLGDLLDRVAGHGLPRSRSLPGRGRSSAKERVFEDYFHRDEDGWIREQTNRHEAGGAFDFDATYIHGVRHAAGEPAVSIHCYSPALWRMGHYEPDDRGIMRRVSMTYADELLGVA